MSMWIVRVNGGGSWFLTEAETPLEAMGNLADKWFPTVGMREFEIVAVVDARKDADA